MFNPAYDSPISVLYLASNVYATAEEAIAAHAELAYQPWKPKQHWRMVKKQDGTPVDPNNYQTITFPAHYDEVAQKYIVETFVTLEAFCATPNIPPAGTPDVGKWIDIPCRLLASDEVLVRKDDFRENENPFTNDPQVWVRNLTKKAAIDGPSTPTTHVNADLQSVADELHRIAVKLGA